MNEPEATASIRHRDYLAAVRDILRHAWDPIDGSDAFLPDDEYDSYVSPVAQLILDGATRGDLANYLAAAEAGMNLRPSAIRVMHVAEKLLRLKR